jgi:hypothetical protein
MRKNINIRNKNDIIRKICGGAGNRFKHNACKYYDVSNGQCFLLLNHTLEIVFEKGRCQPDRLLKSAVKRNINSYKKQIDMLDGNYSQKGHNNFYNLIEIIIFTLKKRLKNIRLEKDYNFAVLKGYINKAAYCEVIRIMKAEGILENKKCKNCIYLSKDKGTICMNQMAADYGKIKKSSSDRGCEKFTPYEVNPSTLTDMEEYTETVESNSENIIIEKIDHAKKIKRIKDVLEKRSEEQKTNNVVRQYEVFLAILKLLNSETKLSEITKTLAKKFNVSDRTIRRDIQEIKTFF